MVEPIPLLGRQVLFELSLLMDDLMTEIKQMAQLHGTIHKLNVVRCAPNEHFKCACLVTFSCVAEAIECVEAYAAAHPATDDTSVIKVTLYDGWSLVSSIVPNENERPCCTANTTVSASQADASDQDCRIVFDSHPKTLNKSKPNRKSQHNRPSHTSTVTQQIAPKTKTDQSAGPKQNEHQQSIVTGQVNLPPPIEDCSANTNSAIHSPINQVFSEKKQAESSNRQSNESLIVSDSTVGQSEIERKEHCVDEHNPNTELAVSTERAMRVTEHIRRFLAQTQNSTHIQSILQPSPPVFGRKVCFSGLSDQIDWNNRILSQICQTHGHVQLARIFFHPEKINHLGVGFVVFGSSTHAESCVSYYTNKPETVQHVWIDIDDGLSLRSVILTQLKLHQEQDALRRRTCTNRCDVPLIRFNPTQALTNSSANPAHAHLAVALSISTAADTHHNAYTQTDCQVRSEERVVPSPDGNVRLPSPNESQPVTMTTTITSTDTNTVPDNNTMPHQSQSPTVPPNPAMDTTSPPLDCPSLSVNVNTPTQMEHETLTITTLNTNQKEHSDVQLQYDQHNNHTAIMGGHELDQRQHTSDGEIEVDDDDRDVFIVIDEDVGDVVPESEQEHKLHASAVAVSSETANQTRISSKSSLSRSRSPSQTSSIRSQNTKHKKKRKSKQSDNPQKTAPKRQSKTEKTDLRQSLSSPSPSVDLRARLPSRPAAPPFEQQAQSAYDERGHSSYYPQNMNGYVGHGLLTAKNRAIPTMIGARHYSNQHQYDAHVRGRLGGYRTTARPFGRRGRGYGRWN